MKEYSYVILGAGPAGLFAASSMKKYTNSFVVIDLSMETVGGLALYGGIKIGLLPAGEHTAMIIGENQYKALSYEFISQYSKYFSNSHEKKTLNSTGNIFNKYYKSLLIERENIKKMKQAMISELHSHILYDTVIDIERTTNFDYCLSLYNGEHICCNTLIIASGRSFKIPILLNKIGQKYHNLYSALIGCRATFDSEKSTHIFNHQHDFKIKAKTGFQNYCFNYRGQLHKLSYCGYQYYSGSLDLRSKTGNTFIGKKLITNQIDLIKFMRYNAILDYKNIKHNAKFSDSKKYIIDLVSFIEAIEYNYGIQFDKLLFPALEQFWPGPVINPITLESENLSRVFFIGDASGVSFGFLQCYITANIVTKKVKK